MGFHVKLHAKMMKKIFAIDEKIARIFKRHDIEPGEGEGYFRDAVKVIAQSAPEDARQLRVLFKGYSAAEREYKTAVRKAGFTEK